MDDREGYDEEKLAMAALALLSLSYHDGGKVSKTLPWSLLDRIHKLGWASDPMADPHALWLTPEGLQKARTVLQRDFSRAGAAARSQAAASAAVAPDGGRPSVDAGRLPKTIVLRCTSTLLKVLGRTPVEVPPEIPAMRDWHATILPTGKRRSILITHSQTLYSVVLLAVPSESLRNIGKEFGVTARGQFIADNLPEHSLVLPSAQPFIVYAQATDQNVTSSIDDLLVQSKNDINRAGGVDEVDVRLLTRRLNRAMLAGSPGGRCGVAAMTALLQSHGGGPIQ